MMFTYVLYNMGRHIIPAAFLFWEGDLKIQCCHPGPFIVKFAISF